MTIRETAIKAMQEMGYDEARIASNLTYMDTTEPNMLDRIQEQVPAGMEGEFIEVVKEFFSKCQANPLNN